MNTRLTNVQEKLGFSLYSKDVGPNEASDQIGNIARGAMRGNKSQFLIAGGGAGKTETSALAASERVHYTDGRKQVLVVESKETIANNKPTYDRIFDAEGIKPYYLTDRVANLSPEEFMKLQAADVIVTTNKIGYEWLPDYGKGASHPEYQEAFYKGLEGGKGFEFVVDEVKTIWDPSLRLAVSGDQVVYAQTEKGVQDISSLKKALAWNVSNDGTVTVDTNQSGTLTSLRNTAMEALELNGTKGLRTLFDSQKAQETGELVLRQDLRAQGYRDILLDIQKTRPELSGEIDTILGEVKDTTAFQNADTAALDAFEQRVNSLRSTSVSANDTLSQVSKAFLPQAAVINTLEKLYGDVARLEIPLRSVHGLRQVADELRGLATRLDCISRYSSGRPALTMMEVYTVVRQCNRKLDRIRGRGRPKKSRNKF